RRHTRFDCDWSSDVCSSDLTFTATGAGSYSWFPKPVTDPTAAVVIITPTITTIIGVSSADPDACNHNAASQMQSVDPCVGLEGRSEERRVGKECRVRRSA